MKTLEDIVKLCKQEAGKVFIMDEQGNVQLVLMGVEEYGKLKQKLPISNFQSPNVPDPAVVNEEILKAQLAEQALKVGTAPAARNPYPSTFPPQIKTNLPKHDLREEVIDPSFDFDAPDDL